MAQVNFQAPEKLEKVWKKLTTVERLLFILPKSCKKLKSNFSKVGTTRVQLSVRYRDPYLECGEGEEDW